jgi:hypothetical protein
MTLSASMFFAELEDDFEDMANYQPPILFETFGVDWETSQIKAIAADLDLKTLRLSIAGGSMVRQLMGTDVFKGDIDLWAHTDQDLDTAMKHFSKQKTWEKTPYSYQFEYNMGVRKTKVQIITRDKPTGIAGQVEKFDFRHCMIGFMAEFGVIHAANYALIDLALKQVNLSFIRDPAYSLCRAIKYKKLGFNADNAIIQLAGMVMKGMKDTKITGSAEEVAEAIAKAAS